MSFAKSIGKRNGGYVLIKREAGKMRAIRNNSFKGLIEVR